MAVLEHFSIRPAITWAEKGAIYTLTNSMQGASGNPWIGNDLQNPSPYQHLFLARIKEEKDGAVSYTAVGAARVFIHGDIARIRLPHVVGEPYLKEEMGDSFLRSIEEHLEKLGVSSVFAFVSENSPEVEFFLRRTQYLKGRISRNDQVGVVFFKHLRTPNPQRYPIPDWIEVDPKEITQEVRVPKNIILESGLIEKNRQVQRT
jgi:hypothetical protein